MRDRWPNLFIVGAPSAGTTSLWAYLGQHPDIFMSRLKEPYFFAEIGQQRFPTVTDPQAYLRLFRRGQDARYRGEGTTMYLSDPNAPERIKRASPDARIIAMLREPAERTYSHYWRRVRDSLERRPFLEVVGEELAHPTPGSLVERSNYAEQLERYFEVFGDAVLVLVFEEFIADVREAVREVCRSLGVDSSFASSFDATPRNRYGLPRNEIIRRLYLRPKLVEAARTFVPERHRQRFADVVLVGGSPPPMEDEARELLLEHFTAQRPRIERILGRSVPWD